MTSKVQSVGKRSRKADTNAGKTQQAAEGRASPAVNLGSWLALGVLVVGVALLIPSLRGPPAKAALHPQECEAVLARIDDVNTLLWNELGEQPNADEMTKTMPLLQRLFKLAGERGALKPKSVREEIALDATNELTNCAREFEELVSDDQNELLEGVAVFLSVLAHTMEVNRRDCPFEVAVVGGGPGGLLSALHARMRGCDVTVFEKRSAYTRGVFFDLYPKPFWKSLETLDMLGLLVLPFEMDPPDYELEDDDSGNGITVRARTLEKKLALAARISGVQVQYGAPVSGLVEGGCEGDTRGAGVQLRNGSCAPFDIAVDASASQSVLRRALGINRVELNSVPLHVTKSGKELEIDDVEQVSVIVNFKTTDEEGGCPHGKQEDDDGNELDSHAFGFVDESVTAIYMRFFFGECHMQVLLSREFGVKVRKELEAQQDRHRAHFEAAPWDLILQISQYYFQKPPSDLEDLKSRLETNRHGYPDVSVFPIRVSIAEEQSQVIENPDENKSPAMMLVVGDASMTAFYRLGIGINSAFSAISDFGEFLSGLLDIVASGTNPFKRENIDVLKKAQAKFEASTQKRVKGQAGYQMATMFYESYCKFMLTNDPRSKELIYSHIAYKRLSDGKKRDYEEVERMSREELVKLCKV